MNRRHFLRLASMAVVGLAIDPEELVWTPRVMITVPEVLCWWLDSAVLKYLKDSGFSL